MSTKGPSNPFGTKSGKADDKINFAWAKVEGHHNRLQDGDHSGRHLNANNVTTDKELIEKSNAFANRIDIINNDSYVDKNGITKKYSRLTRELVVVDKNGDVVTMYPLQGNSDARWEKMKKDKR